MSDHQILFFESSWLKIGPTYTSKLLSCPSSTSSLLPGYQFFCSIQWVFFCSRKSPCSVPPPVSYTHLDVYKRQVMVYFERIPRSVVIAYVSSGVPRLMEARGGFLSKAPSHKTSVYNPIYLLVINSKKLYCYIFFTV